MRVCLFQACLGALCLVIGSAVAGPHGPGVPSELSRAPMKIEARPAASAAPIEPAETLADTTPVVEPVIDPKGSLPIGTPAPGTLEVGVSSAQALPAEEPSVFSLPKGLARTAMALGGVLALIFALAHVFKKASGASGALSSKLGAGGDAPSGIVEVLGRYPLSRGHALVVMRFGRRVLLLSSERGTKKGAGVNMHTLCELTDPDEVAHLTSLVRDAKGESGAARFEQTLHEAGSATDNAIAALMQAQQRNAPVSRPGSSPRRRAPGILSNDEGDRLELTGALASPAAGGAMKRRLGSLRRGVTG